MRNKEVEEMEKKKKCPSGYKQLGMQIKWGWYRIGNMFFGSGTCGFRRKKRYCD